MANAIYNPSLANERVSLRSETDAPLWPRFVAWILDLAIVVALPYLLAVLGFVAFLGFQSFFGGKPFDITTSFSDTLFPQGLWNAFKTLGETTDLTPANAVMALATALNESIYVIPFSFLLISLAFILNHLMLATLTGKTLGKQLVGLKIVTETQAKPGFNKILLRHTVGQLLSSFFFLGYAYALVNPEHRGWHDYISGTRVVVDTDYVPQVGGKGTISSVLSHLGVLVLSVFFAYFLQLLVIWLKILGINVPAFLLPEPPLPETKIEFIGDIPGQTPKKSTKDMKRVASKSSVAGGKRDASRPVDSGSPDIAPQPKAKSAPPDPDPQPLPAAVRPKPVAPKPAAAPKTAPPKPAPVADAVTTPEPSPVAAAPTPAPEPKKRTSEDLGELASADPAPAATQRRTRKSGNGATDLGPSLAPTTRGNGGNGGGALFNPDRTAPGRGIDADGDIDFGPYMNRLQQRVKRQWFAPEQNNSRRTVLQFTIARDGRVSNLLVIRSSGNVNSDEAAMDAVRRAAPFPGLPAKYPGENISINFTFDVNVFSAEERGRGY
jgi:TonB family protein